MRGLKKLTDTSIRVINSKSMGFIYNIDFDTHGKLLAKITKLGVIPVDCATRRTRDQLYRVFEKEFKLASNLSMDQRLENLKDEFHKATRSIVCFNAEGLGDYDYTIFEEFNKEGAPIIFISSSTKYYDKIRRTKTYNNNPVIEHDFAELN